MNTSKSNKNHKPIEIDEDDSSFILDKKHLIYCFEVLTSYLNNPMNHASTSNSSTTNALSSKIEDDCCYPLFVTIKKYDKFYNEYLLRGCIGTFSAIPLREGLKEYTVVSGFNDPRFPPIKEKELKDLAISVSVLVDFENASTWSDFEILKLKEGNSTPPIYQRLQLFDLTYVNVDWTKEETIESLIEKSGYNIKNKQELEDIKSTMQVRRYKSQKMNMTYYEYKEATL